MLHPQLWSVAVGMENVARCARIDLTVDELELAASHLAVLANDRFVRWRDPGEFHLNGMDFELRLEDEGMQQRQF